MAEVNHETINIQVTTIVLEYEVPKISLGILIFLGDNKSDLQKEKHPCRKQNYNFNSAGANDKVCTTIKQGV